MTNNLDYMKIRRLCILQAAMLLTAWLPGGRFEGNEYVVRNPKRKDGRAGSFKINILTGVWYDFAIGDGGSDLISLYAYLNDCSQSRAANFLNEALDSNASYKPVRKTNKIARTANNKYALEIWNKSVPIQGTLAEAYLAKRHLKNLPAFVYEKLRFHKSLKHRKTGLFFPALIACVEDMSGKIVAIQRTYLDPKTSLKANIPENKMTLGSIGGCAVKFGKSNRVIITEGIEDALSLLLICGSEYSAWAGLGGNTGRVDVPKDTQEVVIALDADEAGQMLTDKLAIHLHKQGITNLKHATPEGAKDFNEMLAKGETQDD